MTVGFAICHFRQVHHCLSPAVFEMGPTHNRDKTIIHHSRTRDVINRMTIRIRHNDISYCWFIGTEPLSLTALGIFASKYIWMTTFAFWGHVTSSHRDSTSAHGHMETKVNLDNKQTLTVIKSLVIETCLLLNNLPHKSQQNCLKFECTI